MGFASTYEDVLNAPREVSRMKTCLSFRNTGMASMVVKTMNASVKLMKPWRWVTPSRSCFTCMNKVPSITLQSICQAQIHNMSITRVSPRYYTKSEHSGNLRGWERAFHTYCEGDANEEHRWGAEKAQELSVHEYDQLWDERVCEHGVVLVSHASCHGQW
jgi:hypothetical protein